MTEKLKELFPNPFCVDYQHPHNGQGFDLYDDAKMIEYGKRIVQDCISQVAMMGVTNWENEDISWAVQVIIKNIREHFGIEK